MKNEIDIVFEEFDKAIEQQTFNMLNEKRVKKWLVCMGARESMLHLKHDIVLAIEKSKENSNDIDR